MEAVFFVGSPGEIGVVRSADDLPHEPAGDPLRLESPAALAGLVDSLGLGARGALRQLRDATCQSFPVWCFGREATSAIAAIDEADLDPVAERWLAAAGDSLPDADLYELSLCLGALRDAVRRDEGARLFVLLEEKAW